MKKMYAILTLLSVSQLLFATPQITQPERRVAGAALVMKSDGMLPAEDSIPSDAIDKPEIAVPANKIMEGKPANMDAPIKPEFIVQ